MRILVTGGTGFIGRALCARLLADGHEIVVLSRDPASVAARTGSHAVTAIGALSHIAADETVDVVFNLAGAPIADRRWTAARRAVLRESRIGITVQLAELAGRLRVPPAVMVSGSAIGFYGDAGDALLDESSAPGIGFSAELCRDWEQAAAAVVSCGVRLCLLRTGVVLHPSGGALRRLLPPFRAGLGGPVGNGRQWMSWIHRDDLVSLALFLMERPDCQGAWNGTAPNPVTSREFARALGAALHRPAVLPLPALALRLALGEASGLLLDSQRVLPRRALAAGFSFRHPAIEGALAGIGAAGSTGRAAS
ncbi:MAG: TIGR01777 family oxidoreductase [Gammaproteobacteria bacterium]